MRGICHTVDARASKRRGVVVASDQKPSKRARNFELAAVLANDPARLRTRVVPGESGRGRKRRPRKSNRSQRVHGEEELG